MSRYKGDVRFGSYADIATSLQDVRFTPKSGHVQCNSACPLCANSGHQGVQLECPLITNCRAFLEHVRSLCGLPRGKRKVPKQGAKVRQWERD